MSGKIYQAKEITEDLYLTPDVCVIGSGAGGAVAAAKFAAAGKSVVVLEEGGYFTKKDFTMREGEMSPKLYQDRGSRATSDLSMIILQGRTVGGTTTVNLGSSLRTPGPVLDYWKKSYGVQGFTLWDLEAPFDEVEDRLNIHPVMEGDVNVNNQVLLEGAQKLNLEYSLLKRNVGRCMGLGMCSLGCPINAKRSMHLTYLQDAVSNDALIFANCSVKRLVPDGGRIVEVQGVFLNEPEDASVGPRISALPHKVSVRPKVVVLAGGAINSPGLLLRSKLRDLYLRTGKHTFFHPILITTGIFDRPIRSYEGIPQTVAVKRAPEGSRMGYAIYTLAVHPRQAATGMAGFGFHHRKIMKEISNLNVLIGHIIDGFDRSEQGGTVSITKEGGLKIDYAYTPQFWATAKVMMKEMAQIQFAAGAREVVTGHEEPIHLFSEKELYKIQDASFEPLKVFMATAHQMGGCAIGRDSSVSVVNSDLRHWQYENLYVIDGSIFPTSVSVNPQETICAFATLASQRIIERKGV